MTLDETIEKTRALIGEAGERDYVIAPLQHAVALRESAPALAHVLSRSEIASVAEDYLRKDQQAIAARNEFETTAQWANVWALATNIVSAILVLFGALAPTAHDPFGSAASRPPDASPLFGDSALMKVIFIFLGVALHAVGGVASFWMSLLQNRNLLAISRERRAEAEAQRVRYFQLVTTADEPVDPDHPPEISLPLLELEYFRRYQLDTQIRYYDSRSEDHEKAAKQAVVESTAWTVAASGVSVLAGFLGAAVNPRLASLAALSAVGTVLARYATTRESIHQDKANAERYRKAADALRTLRSKLDDVRKAAALNQRPPIQDFVAAVSDQMTREHAQWLDAAKQISDALKKLEHSLADVKAIVQPQEQKPKPVEEHATP